MNLPNQITQRESIDPKLAVGSSLSKPKELFAIVFALYIVNEENHYLDYSIKKDNVINLKQNIVDKLKSFFNTVSGYDESEVISLSTKSPILEMQLEPLQVTLQLFWKLAKINIIGSNSSSSERSGGNRFPKELLFSTNMDILKSVLSAQNGSLANATKELLYSWLFNKTTPKGSLELEKKLQKTLTIFSEGTLYKLWNDSEEIIFQQEEIYNLIDKADDAVNIKGSKETKGTLRNLKSAISKQIHYYLSSLGDEVKVKDSENLDLFINYKKRVSVFHDLNPKSITIRQIDEIKETDNIDLQQNKVRAQKSDKIQQTIFYGAPGTGKSHKVKELTKDLSKNQVERVTFHPEFDYASFVGGYKPTMGKDEEGKEVIKYEFVPQAFTNIYVKAWKDDSKDFYLVIEEINRGNCAEIFGDIFQLLDRDSQYEISASKELREYLEKKDILGENHEGIKGGKVKLPNNLHILATMNTSDQSLFPMDSAFKRRWDWEYIPINYTKNNENESSQFIVKLDSDDSFSWIDFIKAVNNKIKINDNLGMDKCIGNYFIKPKEKEISLENFINKAIFYLWNDVFKDENEEDSIFDKNTTYEDFFPIETNGKKEVDKLLKYLKLKDSEENKG